MMEIMLTWFRDRVAAEITPQEIDRKPAELADAGRAPATLNCHRAQLGLTYSPAIRNGKVSVNPARLVKLRKENNARLRFLDEHEEAVLRAKIRELYPEGELEFDLALHTGMRCGEQYRLRWQDVDLKIGMITIPRSKHREQRYVPIDSVARRALASLWLPRDGSVYVCLCHRKPEDARGRDRRLWFEEVVEGAGIVNFRWHDLRHTFASRLVMAEADLGAVQELLGHKTIAMTVRYAHLAPAHQLEAVERLTVGSTATGTATNGILEKSKLVELIV